MIGELNNCRGCLRTDHCICPKQIGRPEPKRCCKKCLPGDPRLMSCLTSFCTYCHQAKPDTRKTCNCKLCIESISEIPCLHRHTEGSDAYHHHCLACGSDIDTTPKPEGKCKDCQFEGNDHSFECPKYVETAPPEVGDLKCPPDCKLPGYAHHPSQKPCCPKCEEPAEEMFEGKSITSGYMTCGNKKCPCHQAKPEELTDCSGCTDRHSEGTHAMHTKQHPCPKGGDPNCGYCFPPKVSPEKEKCPTGCQHKLCKEFHPSPVQEKEVYCSKCKLKIDGFLVHARFHEMEYYFPYLADDGLLCPGCFSREVGFLCIELWNNKYVPDRYRDSSATTPFIDLEEMNVAAEKEKECGCENGWKDEKGNETHLCTKYPCPEKEKELCYCRPGFEKSFAVVHRPDCKFYASEKEKECGCENGWKDEEGKITHLCAPYSSTPTLTERKGEWEEEFKDKFINPSYGLIMGKEEEMVSFIAAKLAQKEQAVKAEIRERIEKEIKPIAEALEYADTRLMKGDFDPDEDESSCRQLIKECTEILAPLERLHALLSDKKPLS